MNTWETAHNEWDSFPHLDPDLRKQLDELNDDHVKLEDAFYKELSFGTGGMRGVFGPGTNRMNIYTIRKAVYGLAEYLFKNCVNVKDRGVVVSYDSRYMSQEFAVETAKVLGTFGVKTYVFRKLHPTPLLSYAVRYLGTAAGVMITASHNPPEYNGFKVYNEDGGQITPVEAEGVVHYIQQVENELMVPVMQKQELEENELLIWVEDEIDAAYLQQLKQITRLSEPEFIKEKDMQIVFTPLHGTAYDMVLKGLKQLHFTNVHVVEEQATPDPEFSTVSSPNPEEHQAFAMAIEQGKKTDAAVLIGTDPDADRLGVAVKDSKGEYTVLTGNQFGSLVLHYLLTQSEDVMLSNARMLKTIVTTELARAIADDFDIQTINTLTGFKFIGEKIREFDATGETFLFGFEESYGYLISSFARDKDAVQAAMMACEIAYYWDQKGKTLLEALDAIYDQYGYYKEGMSSVTLKGKEGSEKIAVIMDDVRNQPLTDIAGYKVVAIEDYLQGVRSFAGNDKENEKIDLPAENVVKYLLDNDAWVCLRPSGTEPKIKCYYGVKETSKQKSAEKLEQLKEKMESIIVG